MTLTCCGKRATVVNEELSEEIMNLKTSEILKGAPKREI
jgi:hypothetical protein